MEFLYRAFVAVHVFLYRLTNGRVGGKEGGRDVLLLTTVGRRSGKTRTKPIVYLPDGDNYLVMASAAGTPKHPGWYWNATDDSSPVEIQIKDATIPVTVAELQGEERELAYDKYKQAMGVELIEGYEKKAAGRVFPVLRLTPTAL